jgi:hypothetical protein
MEETHSGRREATEEVIGEIALRFFLELEIVEGRLFGGDDRHDRRFK